MVWFTTLSPGHRDARWFNHQFHRSILGLSERGYQWVSMIQLLHSKWRSVGSKARLSRLNFEARKLPYLHVFWQIFRCEQSLKMSRCPSNSVGQIQVKFIWLSPAEIVLLKPLVYPLVIQHSYWKWPSRNSGFTHWTWWFSSSQHVNLPEAAPHLSNGFTKTGWHLADDKSGHRCCMAAMGIAPSGELIPW